MKEIKTTRVPRGHWNVAENIFAAAKRFETRSAFKRSLPGAHEAAVRLGMLDAVCAHMLPTQQPTGYWSRKAVTDKARTFTSRGAFRKDAGSAYAAAIRHGMLDEVCAHMIEGRRPAGYWTPARIAEEALLYASVRAFCVGNGAAYNRALELGIVEQVCAHMIPTQRPPGYWTEETVGAEAAQYSTRAAFQMGSPSAHGAAHRLGIYDAVCCHMGAAKGGFNRKKSGCVYYLRVQTRHDTLYKIGITNYTARQRFLAPADRARITVLHERRFENGADAVREEKRLHRLHRAHRYVGPAVLLGNGNTELFTRDVLGLDFKHGAPFAG